MTTPGYFDLRGIKPDECGNYRIPHYLRSILNRYEINSLLDIGCGNGHLLLEIGREYGIGGMGIDISPEAIASGRRKGLNVELIEDISEFSEDHGCAYDLIVMVHVLEHLKKDRMIETLKDIHENLLSDKGRLLVVVPNAQSSTGCYWAYEDFQHNWLFTTGSLYYVLLAAGFTSVEFVDPRCTSGLRWPKRMLRLAFTKLYEMKTAFWNNATNSAFHKPSPNIFSYEIKCLAR